tara:strand:+ start:2524 stop:3540 length:1017 start_codon:yes stop_codon:yes gene_type:complete
MSEVNPLLSTKTMQGAAKSVEGLLDQGKVNTKITDEAQKEVAQEEPKKTEAKPEDNSKVPNETNEKTETQPEKEVEVQEEASENDNAEAKQETDLHRIIVNGEKIDVDLDELKAGYQKDADYRRKTEELAIDKRQLISDRERLTKDYSTKMTDLNNLTATLNAEVNSELSSKELDKLFDEDPTEAAKVERQIRRRKETISQAQRKLRSHQEQQFQDILREEQKKVALKHPDFADPVKGSNLKTNMRNYLLGRNFNDQEVNQIYDSRMFDVIMDAMTHQNSQKLKPNLVTKKVKPAKVIKSGVKESKEDRISHSRLEKIKRLQKSGNPRDAADLLSNFI